MKILFTADWQTRLDNLNRCETIVDQIIDLMEQPQGPSWVVHLGDIKHNTNPVDLRVINFLIGAITRIRRKGRFLFVRGNHDMISHQDDVPSCAPLIEALVSQSETVADDSLAWAPLSNTVTIWMVPYFRDHARQKHVFREAAINARAHRGKNILAFHNEVTGCRLSPYRKGEGYTLKEIGAQNYDLCIGGHIHRPQHIPPNVYYVGSPFAMDWSEVNYQHRFLVVEI